MTEDDKAAVGKSVGTGLGMGAGARLGSTIIPVPGLGAFAGGVLGAVVGGELGQRAGRALINAADAFVTTLRADLSGRAGARAPSTVAGPAGPVAADPTD
jgi:hypothetical protein